MKIPKIIHQTFPSYDIPYDIKLIVHELKENNPDWDYRFYTDEDIIKYIKDNYDEKYLKFYLKINKKYGAARADFFRYLVMYKEGGVYLDIKSSCAFPFDEIIGVEDEFFISHWQNDVGMKSQYAGIHDELENLPYGEFQQWYIITKPESPFLKAVIDQIIENINNYNPWIHGVGKRAVLRITGPIAYTKAIYPLLNKYSNTYLRYDSDIGMIYSKLDHDFKHIEIMKNHYSLYDGSLVYSDNLINLINFKLFYIVRKIKRFILN